MSAAVFLDRDNTIIADSGFPRDPAAITLLPGAADGLLLLAEAGWPLVVVSNQSGIARGLLTAADYRAVMDRTSALLAPHGVRFLGDYYCPHLPEISGPCECRKPGVLLFRRAAADHGLDLAQSWYLGDRWRDIAPAATLGGHGILVGENPDPADQRDAVKHGFAAVPDLRAAARLILHEGG